MAKQDRSLSILGRFVGLPTVGALSETRQSFGKGANSTLSR